LRIGCITTEIEILPWWIRADDGKIRATAEITVPRPAGNTTTSPARTVNFTARTAQHQPGFTADKPQHFMRRAVVVVIKHSVHPLRRPAIFRKQLLRVLGCCPPGIT
jgi:hypothetical protein